MARQEYQLNTSAMISMLCSQLMEAMRRENEYNARPEVKALREAQQAAFEAAEKIRKEKEEKARAIRREVSAPRRRTWA